MSWFFDGAPISINQNTFIRKQGREYIHSIPWHFFPIYCAICVINLLNIHHLDHFSKGQITICELNRERDRSRREKKEWEFLNYILREIFQEFNQDNLIIYYGCFHFILYVFYHRMEFIQIQYFPIFSICKYINHKNKFLKCNLFL